MSSSRDYRLADQATPVHAGEIAHITITKGRQADRGTFAVIAREHDEIPGLIIGQLDDRQIIIQRPNGDQPYRVEVMW